MPDHRAPVAGGDGAEGDGAAARAFAEEAAGGRRGGERLPAAFFVLSMVATATFVVVYVTEARWFGVGNTQLLGVAASLALAGIGAGLVLWAKRFMTLPHAEVQPRGRLGSTADEVAAFDADFEVGEYQLERRGLLTRLLAGALGLAGLGSLVTLRSLGPAPPPGPAFSATPWGPGVRLVDEQGQPVRAGTLNPGGVLTVYPEGFVGGVLAQTLLIGVRSGEAVTVEGRDGWAAADTVAFSKVCTHAGCPVGLYQAELGLLLCPCHQSAFDVNQACQPVSGPAVEPLPQLPLGIDDEGFLVARGGFSSPPGPGYWDQDR